MHNVFSPCLGNQELNGTFLRGKDLIGTLKVDGQFFHTKLGFYLGLATIGIDGPDTIIRFTQHLDRHSDREGLERYTIGPMQANGTSLDKHLGWQR